MEVPVFKFAVVDRVKQKGNFTLEGVDLTSSCFVPKQAREKDTGYDVRCAEPDGLVIKPGQYVLMRLGFRAFPPDGWWYELKVRSGTFVKKHFHSLYGTVDEHFESECCFAGDFLPDSTKLVNDLRIEYGERVAQIIPVKRVVMLPEEVSNEELEALYAARNGARGTGGFNSSGNA